MRATNIPIKRSNSIDQELNYLTSFNILKGKTSRILSSLRSLRIDLNEVIYLTDESSEQIDDFKRQIDNINKLLCGVSNDYLDESEAIRNHIKDNLTKEANNDTN